MICDSKADFICLQEVIEPFFEMLVENKHIKNTYYFSGNTIDEYGLLILSKWPAYFYDFPYENTWMNRSLLVAETIFNGKTFIIGTSHLESLDNKYKRVKQMEFIQSNVLKDHDSIFMGDFNFDFKCSEETVSVDWTNYRDVWQSLKDELEEDFTRNGNTK